MSQHRMQTPNQDTDDIFEDARKVNYSHSHEKPSCMVLVHEEAQRCFTVRVCAEFQLPLCNVSVCLLMISLFSYSAKTILPIHFVFVQSPSCLCVM